MELLAVDRSPRRIAAVDRRGLRGRELDRESADGLRRHAGDLRCPLRRLPDAVSVALEVGAIRAAGRRARWQVSLVEPEDVTIQIGLVLKPLARDHVGHGDERRGVGRGTDEHVLVGQLAAASGPPRVDTDHAYALALRP